VRSVSNTTAARAVILIPLIGYWIIFNEHLIELTDLSRVLVDRSMDAPRTAPWRLFATYFGLCLVAIASLLYQMWCPVEVKHYATASEYVGTLFLKASGIELKRIEYALMSADEASKKLYADIQRPLEQDFIDPDRRLRMQEGVKRNELQAYFDLCNRSFVGIRWAVVTFYGLGFSFLMVPSVDIFCRVFWILLLTIVN